MSRGGIRHGAGRPPLDNSEKKQGIKIYIKEDIKNQILLYGQGKNFSDKVNEIIVAELNKRSNRKSKD